MSTLGPGSSNLVNAVATRGSNRVPMIAIRADRTQARADLHPQVLDHNRLFCPQQCGRRRWRRHRGIVMRKALRTAMAERPGPVHITRMRTSVAPKLFTDAGWYCP